MILTGGDREFDPVIALEFETREDSDFDTEAGGWGEEVIEDPQADPEQPSEPGAWGLMASSGRRREEEEDSDYGFDDFEYDDDTGDDELDDDFDEEDDDVDDDLDDFDGGEEL